MAPNFKMICSPQAAKRRILTCLQVHSKARGDNDSTQTKYIILYVSISSKSTTSSSSTYTQNNITVESDRFIEYKLTKHAIFTFQWRPPNLSLTLHPPRVLPLFHFLPITQSSTLTYISALNLTPLNPALYLCISLRKRQRFSFNRRRRWITKRTRTVRT